MDPSDVSRVVVLGGGPDAEREVSLRGASEVAAALTGAGFDVESVTVDEPDEGALRGLLSDAGAIEGAAVVFPVLHGRWGEGGVLQAMLESIGVAFVGSGSAASRLCMGKGRTKRVARDVLEAMIGEASEGDHAVPVGVSDWCIVRGDEDPGVEGLPFGFPFVLKPDEDGSSVGLMMVDSTQAWERGLETARKRVAGGGGAMLAEPRAHGREFTVGVLDDGSAGSGALGRIPAVAVDPATGPYDFEAKYERTDTSYTVGPDLPEAVLAAAGELTLRVSRETGVRHLGRADFMYDAGAGIAWFLELNTMPGFTSVSLLPMAAAADGLDMGSLCSRLVGCAWRDRGARVSAGVE